MAAEGNLRIPTLEVLDPTKLHAFDQPVKKIYEGHDVSHFLTSKAYKDIMTFILQLNRSMVPSKIGTEERSQRFRSWPLGTDDVEFSEPVRRLQQLLSKLESIIEEAPPDTGPRRFGNVSFRKWNKTVEDRAGELLSECIPPEMLKWGTPGPDSVSVQTELTAYLMGSFGSSQRLDYGTGHELSFIAFLACLWKLNYFPEATPGVEERGIVLGVIEPYLELIRLLIKTYTLEPAGSHGVWGLDDHSFLPYILGSAQLAPPIADSDSTPIEGSLPDAPDPSGVSKANIVEKERKHNLYFSAIGFIYDVKKGPFWEHSPMLYDISGIRDGWGKINKGMIKMYNAEVLSKFPVVQHFPFGSLFSWERDSTAISPLVSAHISAQPQRSSDMAPPSKAGAGNQGTKAPWASPLSVTGTGPQSVKPTDQEAMHASMNTTRAPWSDLDTLRHPHTSDARVTKAPWAIKRSGSAGQDVNLPTRAPWAKKDS